MSDSLQLQVAYEIAMATGNSNDMAKMLKEALTAYVRKLNCAAAVAFRCHLGTGDEQLREVMAAVPRRGESHPLVQMAAERVVKEGCPLNGQANNLPLSGSTADQGFWYAFHLPGFGILVLARQRVPFDLPMMKTVEQLTTKLARACTACLHSEQLAKQVEERAKNQAQLMDAQSTLREGSRQIIEIATGLGKATREMEAGVQASTQLATEFNRASSNVEMNVQAVAGAAEELMVSVNGVATSAREAASVAGDAVTMSERASSTVSDLGAASDKIGAFLKVISTIASQTNLLALNATIEAARAGESGRGFAVVASEVKELAKETSRATSEIRERVEEIQSRMNDASAVISEIRDIIEKISDIQVAIATAVQQQAVTTAEITRSAARAANEASEISRNLEALESQATTTQRLTESVKGRLERLEKLGTGAT